MYAQVTFKSAAIRGGETDHPVELTFFTDYSLRVLMYLGVRQDHLCLISDIARDYDISRNHLVKVVHGLARGGFLRTFRGRGGGVTLARKPEDICIGDVVRYTEGAFKPVECFHDDGNCVIAPACFLPAILNEAFRNFIATLDRYTLADLLRKRTELDQILASAARPRPRSRRIPQPVRTRTGAIRN